jgi:predicted transcriptional regulator
VAEAGRGRPRGGLEREVLAALAAAGSPVTPADVQARLGGELAYTTVLTALSRLHAKGAITREPAGRGYAYRLPDGPAGAQESMTAHRMLRLLESGPDRAGVLSRFVADLSPQDEQLLADLLGGALAEDQPGGDPPT